MANHTVRVVECEGQLLSSYGEANFVNVDGAKYYEVIPDNGPDAGNIYMAETKVRARKALAKGIYSDLVQLV